MREPNYQCVVRGEIPVRGISGQRTNYIETEHLGRQQNCHTEAKYQKRRRTKDRRMEESGISNHICKTVYRKGMTTGERKRMGMGNMWSDWNVWVRQEDRAIMQFSSHRMCFRIPRDNETLDWNFVRTILRTVNPVDVERIVLERMEILGKRLIGKFRIQLIIRINSEEEEKMDTERNENTRHEREEESTNFEEAYTSIKYIDVTSSRSGRQQRMV